MSRHAILVHKSSAGSGNHTRGQLERQIRLRGYRPLYVPLTGHPPPRLGVLPADAVIVAGGDGTLRAMLPHLLARDLPVAILPLGTANNVARSLGIMSPFDGLDMPRRGMDVGLLKGLSAPRPFVESTGLGAIAGLLRREAEGPSGEDKLQRGRRALAEELAAMAPFTPRLQLDDEVLEERFLIVEVLNVSHAGPSLVLAPDADPADGHLDVFCVTMDGRDSFLAWLQGDRMSPPPGLRRRARRVRILWDGRCDLRIDDQFVPQPEGPVRVEMSIARRLVVDLPR